MTDAEQCSVIKLKWLTKIFVTGDVLSFLMQASGRHSLQSHDHFKQSANKIIGAGLMVANSSSPSTGEHVIIGGLFVQIVFFGLFTITAIVFQARIAKNPTGRSIELGNIWPRHMTALYISSIFILVRSVVRVVEYLQGYSGYLMKHEVFIYVFDALLMFSVMLVLQYSHPSEINCLLGRGEKYSEKMIKTRKFVPGSALELGENRV